jgi:hypothetical protein
MDRLCMMEHGSSLVQQVIDTELDPAFDYPAERTVVVIHDIIHQKWVVESFWVGWGWSYCWGVYVCRLKGSPDLLEGHWCILHDISTK